MVQSTEPTSHLAEALASQPGIDRDIRVLSKFIRGILFYHVVHDLKNEKDDVLSEDGKLGIYFVKYFLKEANKTEITNGNIIGASDAETKQYLRFLWNKALTMKGRGNIRRELSSEKSAVYAAISDAFKKMLIECIQQGMPFPAFETFDYKKMLPRRFFLFYDTFFQAGRHNKELWTAAIKSDNAPVTRFGTCLIEAHVITTVRENYFMWIFQILSDKRVLADDEVVINFKTEYDCDHDSVPDPCKFACSRSRLQEKCQIRYNEDSECFEILNKADSPTEYKAVQDEQCKALVEIIKKYRNNHEETLEWMRAEAIRLRENRESLGDKSMKEAQSAAKKRLRQFVDKERPTKRRKRKSGNKGRCSTTKVNFFAEQKQRLDEEEKKGLRRLWELVYKKVMNEVVEKDDDSDEEDSNQIMSSYDWVNELELEEV